MSDILRLIVNLSHRVTSIELALMVLFLAGCLFLMFKFWKPQDDEIKFVKASLSLVMAVSVAIFGSAFFSSPPIEAQNTENEAVSVPFYTLFPIKFRCRNDSFEFLAFANREGKAYVMLEGFDEYLPNVEHQETNENHHWIFGLPNSDTQDFVLSVSPSISTGLTVPRRLDIGGRWQSLLFGEFACISL